MKLFKFILFILAISSLTNCASRYKMIEPKTINYVSKNESNSVTFEYKYDLLEKKYEKKEIKKGVKVVAVKVTNNSNRDLVFGRDFTLTYANGEDIHVLENEKAFTTLKQSAASYLWYLLLTPVNFYTSETNSRGFQENTSSTPVGLVLGPGLAAGNMIAAGSANKKFKRELSDYNIYGTTIKQGETKHGLISVKTNTFDTLKLKME